MKHRRMTNIRIAAIHPSRRNQRQRRLATEHRADLHGRGVGAQQATVIEIKGVVHGTGRMFRRNVQCLEVVEFIFHFRTLEHFVPGMSEQFLDPQSHPRDRVHRTDRLAAPRQADIDPPGRKLGRDRTDCSSSVRRAFERRLHPRLGVVDARAGRRALCRPECAQALELFGEHALAPKPVHPELIERREVCAGANLRLRLLGQCGQVSHKRQAFRAVADWSGLCGRRQAASAALACEAIAPKALASWIARSARSFRSISMPAIRKPAIRRL